VILGHPNFYPRFGYSAELARPLESPFSGEAWIALDLAGVVESVSGRVEYPSPFGVFE
jgi:putative acetyltransferase